MSISSVDPWDHVLHALEGAIGWSTPGELAQYLQPSTKQTPALQLIDKHLVEMVSKPSGRLTISIAPQEGKSQRVSRWFPLWLLTRNPDLRIGIASYEHGVARRWGRVIRDDILTYGHIIGLSVRPDLSAQAEWQLEGHEGGVYSVGIGGALTGKALDCVGGDTCIESEHGVITAADAFTRGITRIRAYDHTARRAVWRRVEASRRIPSRRVVDITTKSGRVLTCTPDHRIYTGRGYLPARDLRCGDTLVAVVGSDRVPVREHKGLAEAAHSEVDPARVESLLLTRLPDRRHSSGVSDPVLPMWHVYPTESETVLLRRMHARSPREDASVQGVPAMPNRVPGDKSQARVLLACVRGGGAFSTYDRQREHQLQKRRELREVLSFNATVDQGEGRPPVRRVRVQPDGHLHTRWPNFPQVWSGDSPHQRERDRQPSPESHHAMPGVPRDTPQVETDTVALVRYRSDEEISVYDFQVEGTRNFFADGILVHNCILIDDPVKDRMQADSPVYRERVWDWWREVAATRLSPDAPAAIIATRWHHDDLIGRVLSAEDGPLWEVINIPAQAESADDVLGRKPGEYLESARGRTREQWEAIKVRSGPRTWASLYQGRPAPDEGGIIERAWWQWYDTPLWLEDHDEVRVIPGLDDGDVELVQSWDLAFKGADTSDYVVGQVWLRRGPQAWLLDQVRGRWTFTRTLEEIRALSRRWPQALAKLVEDAANGPAVIDSLRNETPGLIPVQPSGSKVARLSAVSPLIEAGNVYLPTQALAPWVNDLVEETAAFPAGANDDQVDAMTQALHRLMLVPALNMNMVGAEELLGGASDLEWLPVAQW